MTAADFRRLALALPETREAEHMDHPDFRVGGKIFATLAYPSRAWGMVKLDPAHQKRLFAIDADTYVPAPGVWGRRGATLVRLRTAHKSEIERALFIAWSNTAPKRLVRARS
jgi:hypothetical protein